MGPTQDGSYIASLGVPVGAELDPTNAIGYWLVIEGLSPGSHTLHVGGSSDQFTPEANCCTPVVGAFSADLTANIVVVPEPASALTLISGLIGLIALCRTRRTKI
jgi:hypothetical protein